MTKKKRILLCVFLFVFIRAAVVIVSAHPGKTDGSGGHTDHNTDEYHYHHGYPAHYHYDMDGDGDLDCPYNFEDKTDHSPGNSSGNRTDNVAGIVTDNYENNVTKQEEGVKEVPGWVYWIIGGLCCAVLIMASHIRSQSKKLISQEYLFRRIEKDKETEVKEDLRFFHDALVKKFGEDYLYIISGANPGDFVDSNFLPHSASYPNIDFYTFYLGGPQHSTRKYHNRSCRYAREAYAINAYTIRTRKLYQACSLCPCRLPDTAWVDQYLKLYRFLNKYVDLNAAHEEQENSHLGNVTYDMVKDHANHIGVGFNTAQRLINAEREAAGVPPIRFEEKPTTQRYSGDIWDDPNIKINLRDE